MNNKDNLMNIANSIMARLTPQDPNNFTVSEVKKFFFFQTLITTIIPCCEYISAREMIEVLRIIADGFDLTVMEMEKKNEKTN